MYYEGNCLVGNNDYQQSCVLKSVAINCCHEEDLIKALWENYSLLFYQLVNTYSKILGHYLPQYQFDSGERK